MDVASPHHILGHVGKRHGPLLDGLVPTSEQLIDWLAVQNAMLEPRIQELVGVFVRLEVETHISAFFRDQVEHGPLGQGGLR